MSIIVRRANLNEIDEMTELAMLSKQSNGYDDAFMVACREELTVTPERFSIGEYWVAETGGPDPGDTDSGKIKSAELCGCACLVIDAESLTGEVHAFFIHPDFQRKGIGRRLWGTLLMRARQEGIESLLLDADPEAVEFYTAMGFEIVGRSPSGSIEGRYLPKMALKL